MDSESSNAPLVEPELNLEQNGNKPVTWKDLGLVDILCEACLNLNWNEPTKIQQEAIPHALEGKDIIGLAETGSGKTAAFVLPILQSLLERPQSFFALILAPTRELATQICEQVEALGSSFDVKTSVIVGGENMMSQTIKLAKKPHILISTPGRLVDHLENTKGFHLKTLKYLVIDEADRILSMDFGIEVNKILKIIPKERRTFLFSATMSNKVKKLQKASLKDPVRLEVSNKYQTVDKLQQYYLLAPLIEKDIYLVHILNEMLGSSYIIFCSICDTAIRIALMLRNLGFTAIPLTGKMSQEKRLGALNKFRAKGRSILVATNVASRGLDIPHVDVVINFDIPDNVKDYIHRVGRTARAGREGIAINFVTQYDIKEYQVIEQAVSKDENGFPLYETNHEEVMTLKKKVEEAHTKAKRDKKEAEKARMAKKRKKRVDDDDGADSENAKSFRKRVQLDV